MTEALTHSRKLASGPGWRADDVICTAGPGDRPFEEAHSGFTVAAVMAGTFRYRASHGSAVMAPGALLLGNHRGCFECSHTHGAGDRCLSFNFSGDFLDQVAREMPGRRDIAFAAPRIAPQPALERLFAEAEIAREDGDARELGDIALRIAGAALALSDDRTASRPPSFGDERRVAQAIRLIEDDPARAVDLDGMSGEAATSRYHFLRVFRAVTGETPYQFVLRRRMRQAAVRLRTSADPVSAIAFDAGFGDLSTFNRRFRRIMGEAPGSFRSRRAH